MIKHPTTKVLAVAASLCGAVGVQAMGGESLRLLLLGAQDMNTPQFLWRADATVSVEAPKGSRTTQAIALFAPGKDARWYLQLREPSRQALVLGSERRVMERTGSGTQTVPIGAPIADLGISYEDLSRFIADDFKLWQITDEGPETILVGGYPAVDSAYVYRAYTLDKERTLILKGQFYAKSMNNLVKLRRDSDHVSLGKKWVPGTIEIENFPENSKVTLRLRWTQNPTVSPELLAPASFSAAPALAWNTGAPSASPSAHPQP